MTPGQWLRGERCAGLQGAAQGCEDRARPATQGEAQPETAYSTMDGAARVRLGEQVSCRPWRTDAVLQVVEQAVRAPYSGVWRVRQGEAAEEEQTPPTNGTNIEDNGRHLVGHPLQDERAPRGPLERRPHHQGPDHLPRTRLDEMEQQGYQ